MVLARELPSLLLTNRKVWTDSNRRDTAATVLLLMNEHELFDAGLEGFRKGRYRVDSKFVADLYRVLPKALKIELMLSWIVPRLDPKTFKALFLPVFRQRGLSAIQKARLAVRLSQFAHRRPGGADELRNVILGMIRSKVYDVSVLGLGLIGDLNYLDLKDLRLIKRLMLGKKYQRYSACNGLKYLMERRHEVHPSVIEFCLQPEISQIADRIYKTDRDDGARVCAYHLLKELHKAGGPIAPGKRPYYAPFDDPASKRAYRRRRGRRAIRFKRSGSLRSD